MDKLLKNYPNASDREKIIKDLQSLPGEVLMDIANETDSFIPAKDGEVVTVQGGASCNAAGYYKVSNDTLHINPNNGAQTLTHEIGHSVDFNGIKTNTSSVERNKTFMKIYNQEMRQFIAAGNKQYIYSDKNRQREAYCTANPKEMFAECYTLLMTGNCGSKSTIEKYFPRTLAYINQLVDYNRSQSAKFRHH